MKWAFWRRPLTAAKIDKIAALAANPFAQPDVRMDKMERLLAEGSEAALRGLLRRFDANAQGQIADEEEKQWLVGALVEAGEPAVRPLEAYIRQSGKLTHALSAYRRLRGDAAAAAFFAGHLADLGPQDHRASQAKLQLIDAFVECAPAQEVGPKLAPFLLDHSDDVRWAALEAVDRAVAAAGAEAAAPAPAPALAAAAADKAGAVAGPVVLPAGWEMALRPPLRALCTGAEVSARIAGRAARLVAARGWRWLAGDALAAPLQSAWHVDAAGALVAGVAGGGDPGASAAEARRQS